MYIFFNEFSLNSNKPHLVSIVTSSWNRGPYIKKVWKGLSKQTYKNFEWVVADDGSVDDTVKIIKSLAKKSHFKITLIESDRRIGKAALDNLLIENSSGDFLIWNDSDDILEPDALELLLENWDEIPKNERKNFIGILGFNYGMNQKSETQMSFKKITSEVFHWNDLYKKSIGDATILTRKDLIGSKKFPEVDFIISEGFFWDDVFSGKKIKVLYSRVKTMDRSAPGSVSHGSKLEYTKGSLISIALSDQVFERNNLPNKLRIAINY